MDGLHRTACLASKLLWHTSDAQECLRNHTASYRAWSTVRLFDTAVQHWVTEAPNVWTKSTVHTPSSAVPSVAGTHRTRHALQVSLMRQMEKSTRDFADWRKEREKEVMQLRRQVRAHTLPLHHICLMKPANIPEHPDCGIACKQVGHTQRVSD